MVRLKVTGSGGSECVANSTVFSTLKHQDDANYFDWLNTTSDSEIIYGPLLRPGTYRFGSSSCLAFSSDYTEYACSVAATSTVMKYAGYGRLHAHRLTGKAKARVRFTANASRFNGNDGTQAVTTRVSVQRYTATGKWRTIRTATTAGRRGYTFTYRFAKHARYRVLTTETGSAFSATSPIITI